MQKTRHKLKAKTIATMDNDLSILISYMLVPPIGNEADDTLDIARL